MQIDDALFTDHAAEPLPDILSLTRETAGDLPDATFNRLKTAARSTAVHTVPEFRRRVAELIHMQALSGMPISVMEINRLFARTAQRLKSTVSDVVQHLESVGLVCMLEKRNVRVAFSAAVFAEMQNDRRVSPETFDGAPTLLDELIGNYERA